MEVTAAADQARSAANAGSMDFKGIVAIWNDIRPEAARADFYEWHNREHMPERVDIPGFQRGRRLVAVDARPEFFTLYDTDGPDYLERLNNPTSWTRRAIATFVNTSRCLCTVAFSLGTGEGGLMMTVRYEVAGEREAEMTDALTNRALPMLVACPGVVRARLCVADRAASSVQTAEKKNAEQARVPSWIILVEGGTDAAALRGACDELLSPDALASAGAVTPIERGLYQLQYARFHDSERTGQ